MGKYVNVSVPKNSDGAGAATIKDPTVILIDVNDIDSEPTREVGNTEVVGDITLKKDAKAVGIYATPSSISITEESNGEVDSRTCTQGVEYTHPGDSVAIANHAEANMNRGIIALVKECDGSAAGRVRLIGSKCNPLYLAAEYTNSSEGANRKFVWKQNQGGKFVVGTYKGAMPVIADDAATEASA